MLLHVSIRFWIWMNKTCNSMIMSLKEGCWVCALNLCFLNCFSTVQLFSFPVTSLTTITYRKKWKWFWKTCLLFTNLWRPINTFNFVTFLFITIITRMLFFIYFFCLFLFLTGLESLDMAISHWEDGLNKLAYLDEDDDTTDLLAIPVSDQSFFFFSFSLSFFSSGRLLRLTLPPPSNE